MNIFVMSTKRIVSCARQRSCTSVVGGKKAPCQEKAATLQHPPYSLDSSPTGFFPFQLLKSVLKGQRFACAEEVCAKATRAVIEVSRNEFQECLQKTLEVGKRVSLLKGTVLEEVLCK
jgi:hypothetical protein